MTTSKADGSAASVDDGDWLGYGAYADALWIRTMRALDKDKDGKKPLGDDPLVIGIFGEWGGGQVPFAETGLREGAGAIRP